MKTLKVDKLEVEIFPSRKEMGEKSAKDIEECIVKLLEKKAEINMIFAAAPSQNDVLKSLVESKKIEWNRINAYHMDEYIGLSADAPQGFGNFLKEHIFGLVPFKSVNYIDVTAKDPEKEAERYGKILKENPTDIVVMGIGENGHIAFNDPPVANFKDTKYAKPVKLDEVCRQQQVNDGCFKTIEEVPTHAYTITIPELLFVKKLYAIVPTIAKANAIKGTCDGPIVTSCPASILRTHRDCTLYVDRDSASLVSK